eukprot:CAMPEP_0116031250 /NCGR_PEP_ID=MMETSP0321-20121206/17392_1 /TAXON_ID=163516 /ORGANISM="Leptocylindrus danicus var. danicus, Strain B650" /LENGTH=437 /DNA_ID=CAMNT_0003506319 /DNA_START=248 /DNA_END=1562 /DNA_ORIENTATION=+
MPPSLQSQSQSQSQLNALKAIVACAVSFSFVESFAPAPFTHPRISIQHQQPIITNQIQNKQNHPSSRSALFADDASNNNEDDEDVWSDDAIDFNSLLGGDEIMETLSSEESSSVTRDDVWNADSDWGGTIQEDGTVMNANAADTYESSFADDESNKQQGEPIAPVFAEDDGESWLDQLAQITADEIEFMDTETERADMQRQMLERGYSSGAIEATLGLATDDALERELFNNEALDFIEADNIDLEDLKTVESHTRVELDEDTGEPIRTQMVYVDEHTCIGCTNCAMVAQSTFFMEEDLGRARVFQQWGDDEETIQVAIETCPVDCIHYVPYEELKRLEIDRRGQNINFKARLVSQGEYGGGQSHNVGGATGFTAPQKISGNMGSRCNNCPSRGCKNCPMYGIGKNPEFERKEKERKRKREERKLRMEMEKREKRSDL